MSRLTWREAVRIHEERTRADRQATPPEDASGMRCLGCGYYDDEPQAQRMCMAGEGTGHAFVRVGPDGCVPVPDDDPATLRARLQERYERPERPCTYDPADEEPEAEPISRVDIEHRWTNPEAPPLTLRMEYEQADWTPPRPEPLEYSGIPVVVDPEQEEGTVRLVAFDPMATRYPSDMFAPPRDASARADEILRHPLTGTSTWGTLTLPPGGDAFEVKPDGTPHAGLLRSYLRTLTNPDATPEDVNGALDALTPEDRALVSEALPSWGSARMTRFEALAPFMDRFETMVRERDPRAHEEGTLLLSALRENDPTRSTVEALMEIAKTPKVTP